LGSRAPATVKPGQRIVLAHYFQAQAKAPGGFGLFVHVVDSVTGQLVVNADHEIQEGQMPLESWPIGKVIEDVHAIPIPIGAPAQLRVMLGFWRGDQRLPVDQLPLQDGQNRMLGPPLVVESESLPEYHVVRARSGRRPGRSSWSTASMGARPLFEPKRGCSTTIGTCTWRSTVRIPTSGAR
jgi:hypothetical protein